MIQPLQWFPKRFSPGDMDASGGDRLLGKTELSRLAVLIRETAQNSWTRRMKAPDLSLASASVEPTSASGRISQACSPKAGSQASPP